MLTLYNFVMLPFSLMQLLYVSMTIAQILKIVVKKLSMVGVCILLANFNNHL
jgi:hypothetical protein